MSEYYRDTDNERRRRYEQDDELRDDVRDWFNERERRENQDPNRDWDQTRQWRSGKAYDRNRDQDTYGSQYRNREGQTRGAQRDWNTERDYTQDYDRGQYRNRDVGYGDYGRAQRGGWGSDWDQDWDYDRSRYTDDYARGYNRSRMRSDFEDYDYDFDAGSGLRSRNPYRDRGQQNRDRDQNRSQVSYSRGYRDEFDQGYGRQQDYGRGEQPRRRYGVAGMGSDYQGDSRQYRSAGMRSDYGSGPGYRGDFYNEEDVDYRSGYVGYDREGAFYQDLDEPYSYEYWEVWMVPGEFTGMGPQNFQRSDDRIHEDVCERLTRHGWIDASDIELRVNNGEVTLTGSVPDKEMKRLAEDTVEAVAGVKDVHNDIRVRKQERQSERDWSSRGMASGQSETGMDASGTSTIRTSATTAGTPITGDRMSDDQHRQLREGMEVIGKNGKIVGRVKEVRNNDFLVNRGLARDVYVPFNAVKSIGAQAQLEVAAEEVDNQDWEKPEVI